MTYDKQILMLLTEAGEAGMSVALISRKVYNANCSFFEQIDYNEIHQYVLSYLQKKSKCRKPLLESTGKRGFYRINAKSDEAQQLMLHFVEDDVDEEPEDKAEEEDLSLSLF